MRRLILAALLLVIVVDWAQGLGESDQRFLFDDGGGRKGVTVFTQKMRHRQTLHVGYGVATAAGNASLAFVSRGRHRWLKFMPSETQMSLSLSQANPLWARWRYAVVGNLSLTLTNQLPAKRAADSGLPVVRLPCRRDPAFGLCHVMDNHNKSSATIGISDTSGLALGQFRLVIDPDRTTSSLPPELYFLLTNGRARWHKTSNDPLATVLDAAVAQRVSCIDAAGLRVCERDMGHFDLSGLAVADERNAIIIGSSFWVSNTTEVLLDGWTNELTMQLLHAASFSLSVANNSGLTAANVNAMLWCALAMACVGVFLVYSRWINYPATPNVGLLLWHLHEHVGPGDGDEMWTFDYKMTLNLFAVVLLGLGTTLVSAFTYLYLPTVVGQSPYWQTLQLGLLFYGLAQTIVAFLLIATTTPCGPPDAATIAKTTWRRFMDPVRVPIPIAWFRNLTQGTAALAFISTALVPLAYDGSISGSMALLFLLLPSTMMLIFHHTYYTVVLLALASSRLHSMRKRVAVVIGAVFELFLLFGIAAVLTVFYIAPVVDSASPFFGEVWNFLLSFILTAIVIAGACIWVIAEIRLVVSKLLHTIAVFKAVEAQQQPPPPPQGKRGGPITAFRSPGHLTSNTQRYGSHHV